VLLLCLAGGRTAGAAPAGEAAAVLARGERMLAEGDFAAALAQLERAYRLEPRYSIQCSAARCLEGLGRYVEAVKRYRHCLELGAVATEEAQAIHRALKRAEARISWVTVAKPGPDGTVRLDSGKRIALDPGCHAVEVQGPGGRSARFTLRTDGEPLAVALVPLGAGSRVALEASGASGPGTQPVAPRRRTRRRLSPPWFWSSVALTAALMGASIALGVETLRQRSDYEAQPTREGYDTFVNLRLSSNILWALTAVAAGSSTVLYFYTDFGGGGGGAGERALVTVRGRF